MASLQLNAEVLRAIDEISDDETLMNKVLKYVKRLAAKGNDSTLMTKEEFFAHIDEAKKGKTYSMMPDENLTEFLKRNGYEVPD